MPQSKGLARKYLIGKDLVAISCQRTLKIGLEQLLEAAFENGRASQLHHLRDTLWHVVDGLSVMGGTSSW
jgi:hypothetical protein